MVFSPIDEIKNRLDIVEVISSYIKLQKTGANFRALCPFHSEKKPSFFVSPARQIWHCFGCGTGGDIFKFVMKIEGVEFGDALRILAQKAGVELKRQTPQYKEWQTERQRLYEICELAACFFEKQLESTKTGKEVKKYLLSRGINKESVKKWHLGYAPDTWQGLSDFLVGRGYKRAEIVRAGLAVKKESINENSSNLSENSSDTHDRFRGRIIFPIFDLNSQVIGFGGRVFGEKEKTEVAKYVNTPNTLLYNKSRVLYGLDKAKGEIRKKDACILVEGYTDVIMAHQAGTSNVVATSGTALTPYQLKFIKRYSENLILGFDMDVAGDSATKRGIDLAQSLGFNLRVTRLLEGEDTADIILKNPKEWQTALENPKSILEFYFQSAFSGRNPKTPEGKKAISKILLPIIKRIPNNIERFFWVQLLAKRLEVEEECVVEELKKIKLSEDVYGLEPEEIVNLPQKSRKELLEETIAILILKEPENLKSLSEKDFQFFSSQIKEFLSLLKNKKSVNQAISKINKLNPQVGNLINHLLLKSEIEDEEEDTKGEFQNCLKEIRHLEIKDKLDKISKEIKKAEEEKNSKELQKLIEQFNQYSKSLNNF